MSSQQQNRQPKGTPTGGQYAEMRRPSAEVQLLDPESADPWVGNPATEALEAAAKIGSSPWEGGVIGVDDGAIQTSGAGGAHVRRATVFPWLGGWRFAVTEYDSAVRANRQVAAGDTDSPQQAIRLAELNLGWGETGVKEGSRTPWGPAQHITEMAPGITIVDTDSHGGVKLSKERNREVHPALRRSSGWYEEDSEAHIVGMTFPNETRPRTSRGYGGDRSPEEWEQISREGVRNWYPDAYEKATGETIEPGESHTRDYDNWTKAHVDDWVVNSASSTNDPSIVEVTAARHGEEKTFRVPAEEYRSRHDSDELGRRGRFVVDPARHEEVDVPPPPPKTPTQRYTGVRLDGLTASQRSKVEKDLAKLYRNDDGSVSSVRELIEGGKISGKTAHVDNGKRTYSLAQKEYEEDSSYSVLPVSKATWDAFQGPDTRSSVQVAQQEVEYQQHRVDELGGRSWGRIASSEVSRATERLHAAEAELKKVIAEKNAGS